jgi:two-component system, OmpR family, response regulator
MNTNSTPPPAHILVADDEDNTRQALLRALQLSGYETEGAANGREVLEQLRQSRFDLLLLDLHMPEVNGEQVLEFIRHEHLNLAVIVLTAHATLDSAIASVKAGAVDYLLKPQRIADIETAIRQALERNMTHHQREQLIEAAKQTLSLLESELDEENHRIDPPESNSSQSTFRFDREQRLVTLYSAKETTPRVISLTADQAAILDYMTRNPKRALSGQEIAKNALNYTQITAQEADKLIRSHILRLRKKIELDPRHPSLIRTLRDAGYIFSPPDIKSPFSK